ncbi:hypothetical protein AB0K60_05575, partial [Thermopolyspora sp. NPDC052614]
MPKLDGMNPQLVRQLLTELQQAAKKMRAADARVAQLLSSAGVPLHTSHRPSQVADAADDMIRDVKTRLAALEKEEKQKKPGSTTPDSMGGKKPSDDPKPQPGESDKSDHGKGSGAAESGKSASGKDSGAGGGKGGEADKSNPGSGAGGDKGGESKPDSGKDSGAGGEKGGDGKSDSGKGSDAGGGKGGEADKSNPGSGAGGDKGGESKPDSGK